MHVKKNPGMFCSFVEQHFLMQVQNVLASIDGS